MEVRHVKARQGLQWIMSGFYLFRMAPMVWMLLCFTLILIAMTLAILPLLGQFIFTLISPVFLAGLMLGCRDLEQGKKLDITHLFAGFKKNTAPLVTVGGIYLIGQVLIVGIVMLIGGTAMMEMLLQGKRVNENELMEVADDMLSATLVALALSIPLLMAAWFSPLLVAFHNMPPVLAMKKSFFACLKNLLPLQLYGVILIILTVIAIIPWGLGLIVLIPIIFTSIYVSYKDIFLSESLTIKESQSASPEDMTWSNTEEEIPTEGDMVKCDQCGLHILRNEAISAGDKYFCSDEHRQQYQSSSEKKETD
jgi:uncharacterized membrane protein